MFLRSLNLKKNARRYQSVVVALTAFVVTVAGAGCRAKMETTTKSGGPVSAAISIDDRAVGQRHYFQSRSVITIPLNQDHIKNGDRFAVVNETTGEILIDQQELDLSGDLQAGEGFDLLQEGFDVLIRIYPRSEINFDKLVYGSNKFRLDIEGKEGPKFLEHEIVLRDFPMFGTNGALFSKDQSNFNGLQGSFTGIVRPIVRGTDEAGKGYVLRSSFFHAVNH